MDVKFGIIPMRLLWNELEFSKENVYEYVLENIDLKNLISKNI